MQRDDSFIEDQSFQYRDGSIKSKNDFRRYDSSFIGRTSNNGSFIMRKGASAYETPAAAFEEGRNGTKNRHNYIYDRASSMKPGQGRK